jgi:hypothetical protein
VCLTNKPLHNEGVWGSGCIDPHILDIGTTWKWVVSFTPRPLYPRGKSPRNSLDKMLGGLQSRSGSCGENSSVWFEVFTAATMKMSSSTTGRCVDLALTDVSEERIACIFRVEKSASGKPAWAVGCRMSHQSEITSYRRIGREGE